MQMKVGIQIKVNMRMKMSDFNRLSRTLKDFNDFQGLSRSFKDFQGLSRDIEQQRPL